MGNETLLQIVGYVAGVLLAFWLGYLGWLLRRLHAKVEDSVTRKEMAEAVQKERLAIDKEIAGIKGDTRNMADSILTSIKSLEDRLDKLMINLMNNQGGGR